MVAKSKTVKLIPITKIKKEYLYTMLERYVENACFFGIKLTINIQIASKTFNNISFFTIVIFLRMFVENFNVMPR